MKKMILAAALAVAPGVASAGAYTDEMSKCLVTSATPTDNETMVK